MSSFTVARFRRTQERQWWGLVPAWVCLNSASARGLPGPLENSLWAEGASSNMASHKVDPRGCGWAFNCGVKKYWPRYRFSVCKSTQLSTWKEPFQKPRAGDDSLPRSLNTKEEDEMKQQDQTKMEAGWGGGNIGHLCGIASRWVGR